MRHKMIDDTAMSLTRMLRWHAIAAMGLVLLASPAPTLGQDPVLGPRAFIASLGPDVTVMNAETNEIIAVLAVGRTGWPAVQPGGQLIYLPLWGNPSHIGVFDSQNYSELSAPIPVGEFAQQVTFHPSGTRAYVPGTGMLRIIDTRTHTVSKQVAQPGLSTLGACIAAPDGLRVYCAGSATIYVLDTASEEFIQEILLSSSSTRVDLAISEDSQFLYVPGLGAPTLRLVDLDTGTVIDSFDSGGASYGVALGKSGQRVYLPDLIQRALYVLTADTLSLVDTVAIPGDIYGVEVHPLGHLVYVTDRQFDGIWPVSTETHTVLPPVAAGSNPPALAFAPPEYPSPLLWPLEVLRTEQGVSLAFGSPWPYSQCGDLDKVHAGTDYPNPVGTVVRAIASGVIRDTFVDDDFAGRVVVESQFGDEVFTTVYWHIDASVEVGQSVTTGALLGTLADISSGSHLHLGVRLGAFDLRASGLGALPQVDCGPDRAYPEQFLDTELLSFVDQVIFTDGFESGDTGRWQ